MPHSEHDPGLTSRVRSLLEQAGAAELAPAVAVHWNHRMRSTAGTAQPRTGCITLNPRLLTVDPAELERTLRHEAAHLLAGWRAGRRRIRHHGPEWRQACADLGIPGEKVTHALPFPRRRVAAKHFYQCPRCGIQLRRVRPIKRPTACLVCCRQNNRGQFDARFLFRAVPPPLPTAGQAFSVMVKGRDSAKD